MLDKSKSHLPYGQKLLHEAKKATATAKPEKKEPNKFKQRLRGKANKTHHTSNVSAKLQFFNEE